MTNMTYTVTMLASPSLTPGTAVRGSIWASAIKIVRAMAVSRASRVIRPAPLTGPAIQITSTPYDLEDEPVGQADDGHGPVRDPALIDADLIGTVRLRDADAARLHQNVPLPSSRVME